MDLSYWEQETYFSKLDVVIIGSGIVGLNAAIQLKSKHPSLKVAIVERGILPTGASSKNAGFACFGSATELLDDLSKNTEEEVFSLVEKRWKGLQKLRKNLGDKNIDFNCWGGYEIFDDTKHFTEAAEKIEHLNKNLSPIIGNKQVFSVEDQKINEFGFKKVKNLIANNSEGQIDTGKMIFALTQLAQQRGVIILNSIEVTEIEQQQNELVLQTDKNLQIKADKVLIATNGFARQFLPEFEVFPARAQVIVTSSIKDLKVKGTFHFQQGYYYFRNINDRILFGGGRNLDFKTEETTAFGLTEIVQNKLEDLLREMILPGIDFTINYRWSGIMGVGPQKKSIIKQVDKNIFCAVRMGGMGVAIGSLVGEEAADLMLQS